MLIGVLVGINVSYDIFNFAVVSWSAVATGFLVFSLALGPGANSFLGKRIGQWFRNIGVSGRSTVIVLFALGAVVTFQFDAVPADLIADAASGGLLATLLYLIAYVLWAGEVSGWKGNQENND